MKTWIGIGASFGVAAMLGALHYADANAVAAVRRRDHRARAARVDGRCRHGDGRLSLRPRHDGRSAVDARQPARALHRRLRAASRRDRRRPDVDPRLAARERAAHPRAGDHRRRIPLGRRRHALPHAPAERHDDAADARRLHDRDHLDLDLARRQGVGQRGDDLGHRCGSDPLRLRRLDRELPEGGRAAGAGDRGGACAGDELSRRASSSSRWRGSQPPSRPSGSSR